MKRRTFLTALPLTALGAVATTANGLTRPGAGTSGKQPIMKISPWQPPSDPHLATGLRRRLAGTRLLYPPFGRLTDLMLKVLNRG